jgi:hypothetical protein
MRIAIVLLVPVQTGTVLVQSLLLVLSVGHLVPTGSTRHVLEVQTPFYQNRCGNRMNRMIRISKPHSLFFSIWNIIVDISRQ